MKRYHKSIIASTMILSLALSNNIMTTTLFAETTATTTSVEDTINAVDVEVINQEIYVKDDKNTLWLTNEVDDFEKVSENVQAVYAAYDYGCLILKTDGTLVYALEKRNTYTDEKTGELKLDNKWDFFEIEKDVKSVSSEFMDQAIFILKNDGSVIYLNNVDVYYKKLTYKGTEYEKYFTDYELSTVPKKTVIATGAKTMVGDALYGPMIYYTDENDTLYALVGFTETYDDFINIPPNKPYKLLENVKTIETWATNRFALTTDGKVYALGEAFFNGSYYDENNKELFYYEPAGIVDEVLGFEDDLDRFGKANLICEDVKEINVNSSSVGVIKNDNSLWMMGDNSHGLIGVGESIDNSKYTDDTFALAEYATNPKFAGTFVKVAEDVADVESNVYYTIYTTLDGKLFATGETGSIQTGDDSKKVYLDSNGFYSGMTDVADMSLGNWYSVTLKEDGSLWGFGNNSELANILEVTPVTTEPEKLLNSVNWANENNGSILYTTGENNDLYNFGVTSDICNKVELYKYQLLGFKNLTLEDIENETREYNDVFYSFSYKNDKQKKDIYKKLVAYTDKLVAESNSKLIASNVKYAADNYYLTFDNQLFERTDTGNTLVAEDVDTFYSDSRNLYIVDTKGNLKYSSFFDDFELYTFDREVSGEELQELFKDYYDYNIAWDFGSDNIESMTVVAYNLADEYNFIDTGISNVKDVKTNIQGVMDYDFDIYILDKNNNFSTFLMEYLPTSKSSKKSDLVLNFKDYAPTTLGENVKEFDTAIYSTAFLTTDGVLYGVGENVAHQFSLENFNYFYTPVEVTKGIEKVDLNSFGGSMFMLKTDGTLLSSGGNEVGELGFPSFNYDDLYVVNYTPTEVDLSK